MNDGSSLNAQLTENTLVKKVRIVGRGRFWIDISVQSVLSDEDKTLNEC